MAETQTWKEPVSRKTAFQRTFMVRFSGVFLGSVDISLISKEKAEAVKPLSKLVT